MSAKFNKEKLIEETRKSLKMDVKKEEGIQILTEKENLKSQNTPTQMEQTGQKMQETPAPEPTPTPKEEAKSVGIRQQLEDVNEKLDMLVPKAKDKKNKPFKLGWGVSSKLKGLAKKDSVLVFLLKTNRTIEPTTAKIENGFIVVNDKYHNCSVDFIYMWQGKFPAIVLNEWDTEPVGTKDYYDAIKGGRNVNAQTVIIRALEQAALEEKKKIGGMKWILIIIGGLIVGYILFAGQKK